MSTPRPAAPCEILAVWDYDDVVIVRYIGDDVLNAAASCGRRHLGRGPAAPARAGRRPSFQ